jgi:hypothetical protein
MPARRDPTLDSVPNRIQALALDIAHRLRPVCAHMPDDELLSLSTHIASVELKYFEQAVVPQPPRSCAATG